MQLPHLSQVHSIRLHKLSDRARTLSASNPPPPPKINTCHTWQSPNCIQLHIVGLQLLGEWFPAFSFWSWPYGHIPEFTRSSCNNKNNIRKNASIYGGSLHPNWEPIITGILFNKFKSDSEIWFKLMKW